MPENDDPRRADWSAIYYHRADRTGIGFDRTTRGSDAVGQYRPPLRERWNDPANCPELYLLWFHRLPWDHRLASGETLWQGLVRHYRRGAEEAASMVTQWETLRGKIDEPRYLAVLERLRRQAADAAVWRDKCLKYFQGFSQLPLSNGSKDDGTTDQDRSHGRQRVAPVGGRHHPTAQACAVGAPVPAGRGATSVTSALRASTDGGDR
jgi:alpha-glucuronidase